MTVKKAQNELCRTLTDELINKYAYNMACAYVEQQNTPIQGSSEEENVYVSNDILKKITPRYAAILKKHLYPATV